MSDDQRQNLKMMSDKGDDEGGEDDDALTWTDMGDEEKEDEARSSPTCWRRTPDGVPSKGETG